MQERRSRSPEDRTPDRRWRRVAVAALGLVAVAACSDSDPVSPEARISGTYEAITWTMTSAIGSYDLLAAGSSLTIELHADGTTSGEFYTAAGAAPDVKERRVDLAGTWLLSDGDIVTFEMEGDTYVRFVEWKYGAGRLENLLSIGGWTTRTVLRREVP